ncbi:hypothetical protein NSA47_05735 [Irregularibacter muris]|uniref:Uncharacterized protein n=1 Tax=Irregularibacter muris TaxID=1796619 RepID=A0AAE3HDI4_9FIRM|nr:hypothetical protein [Irregularibacter muris]MCR1898491.1 hypothetical protein [Irregularibacter muris]
MVKGKKLIILLALLVLILLGAYAPNKINVNNFNPSPITFEKKDNFNVSHKTIELKFDESQKNLELIDIKKDNEIYVRYDNSGKMVYAIKNLNTNKDLILYKSESVFATALSGVYKDKLYVVETLIEGDKFISYIVLVDKQKNVHRYPLGTMNKIPYVYQVDNLLLINYESGEKNQINSYLSYFDMDTNRLDSITEEQYKINSSGTVTGNYILFAGGMENSIYYQVVEYNNEDIEKDGKSYLYKIDRDNKESIKKITTLNEKLIFISGDENSLITSDYMYEAPFYDSGKLYVKNKNKWLKTTIPHITAGRDIIGVEKIGDNVLLIYNNESYYLYNYESKNYVEKTYRKEDSIFSRIRVSKNNFFYLEKTNNKYFLQLYTYIDSN